MIFPDKEVWFKVPCNELSLVAHTVLKKPILAEDTGEEAVSEEEEKDGSVVMSRSDSSTSSSSSSDDSECTSSDEESSDDDEEKEIQRKIKTNKRKAKKRAKALKGIERKKKKKQAAEKKKQAAENKKKKKKGKKSKGKGKGKKIRSSLPVKSVKKLIKVTDRIEEAKKEVKKEVGLKRPRGMYLFGVLGLDFTLYSPCIYIVFTLYLRCIHLVFTLYLRCIHIVFTHIVFSICTTDDDVINKGGLSASNPIDLSDIKPKRRKYMDLTWTAASPIVLTGELVKLNYQLSNELVICSKLLRDSFKYVFNSLELFIVLTCDLEWGKFGDNPFQWVMRLKVMVITRYINVVLDTAEATPVDKPALKDGINKRLFDVYGLKSRGTAELAQKVAASKMCRDTFSYLEKQLSGLKTRIRNACKSSWYKRLWKPAGNLPMPIGSWEKKKKDPSAVPAPTPLVTDLTTLVSILYLP